MGRGVIYPSKYYSCVIFTDGSVLYTNENVLFTDGTVRQRTVPFFLRTQPFLKNGPVHFLNGIKKCVPFKKRIPDMEKKTFYRKKLLLNINPLKIQQVNVSGIHHFLAQFQGLELRKKNLGIKVSKCKYVYRQVIKISQMCLYVNFFDHSQQDYLLQTPLSNEENNILYTVCFIKP